jgi:hypothetical protein
MHRALNVNEIISLIVGHLDFRGRWGRDKLSLVALATTNRAFSEPALNKLWAAPQLWDLAKTMEQKLWVVKTVNAEPAYECFEVRAVVSTFGPVCLYDDGTLKFALPPDVRQRQ